MANFIKEALDKVLTYETPPAVVKYMEMQSALGNPPWKKRREMFKILLDNEENDKTLLIEMPIIPRQFDWIRLDNQDEFTGGDNLMAVKRVILNPENEIIIVIVNSFD
jgi:hypothetical protein